MNQLKLMNKFMCTDNLLSYDPYDIWKTKLGIQIRRVFYKNKYLGLIPAASLNMFDYYLNNTMRRFYKKQEFPIVRAQAALALITLYKENKEEKYLEYAKKHIDWLIHNYSKGYSGYCWEIGRSVV